MLKNVHLPWKSLKYQQECFVERRRIWEFTTLAADVKYELSLVIYDGGKFRFFALSFASSGERIQELVKSAFHDFPLDFVRLIVLERLTACVKAIC